ncbi:MAG: nuclear transport factor 2 family protein [Acidobacteria bacterium]|nr:nuclear transport factor 2 family protein [Acidobacteriota bacterium]
MQTMRTMVAAALAGGLVVGAWVHTQGSSSAAAEMALSGTDIAQIEQLYARYNQGWDFKDVELYLSAYTDDAVFTTGAGVAHEGKDAIRDYLTTGFANGASGDRTHNNTSILITPTADGAKGRGYWYVVDVMSQPPAIAGAGYYDDTFVRTPDGWRMKSRTSTRGWRWRLSQ